VGRLGLVLRLGLGLQLGIGIGFRRNHSWSSTFTPRRNHSLCLTYLRFSNFLAYFNCTVSYFADYSTKSSYITFLS